MKKNKAKTKNKSNISIEKRHEEKEVRQLGKEYYEAVLENQNNNLNK